MNTTRSFSDASELAQATADESVAVLRNAINNHGGATWVLAGGSTPLLAYNVIAEKYSDALDWSKVTVVMGDERIGPLDGSDNNWHAIDQIIGSLPTVKLRPQTDKSAEEAAADYEQQLVILPRLESGLPRLDLVWLGVGQDGHTLSLFPRHTSMLPSGGLVAAVHDSPKTPADRITLTLRALQGTANAFIIATGTDKQATVTEAMNGGHLPIALAADIIMTHDGKVTWYLDKYATPTD